MRQTDQIRQIVALAKNHRQTEIARRVGVSRQWVSQVLKWHGVIAVGQQAPRDTHAERNQKIAADFEAGVPVDVIADRVSLRPDYVRRILRDQGRPASSRSEARQQKIIDLYRADVPLVDIGVALGVSRRWIHKVLAKHGVPLRSPYYQTTEGTPPPMSEADRREVLDSLSCPSGGEIIGQHGDCSRGCRNDRCAYCGNRDRDADCLPSCPYPNAWSGGA